MQDSKHARSRGGRVRGQGEWNPLKFYRLSDGRKTGANGRFDSVRHRLLQRLTVFLRASFQLDLVFGSIFPPVMSTATDLIDDLQWRGLLADCTDLPACVRGWPTESLSRSIAVSIQPAIPCTLVT